MNISEISKIAKLMKDYDLTQFSLESEDMRLKMKRGGKSIAVPQGLQVQVPAGPAPTALDQAESAPKEAEPVEQYETIDSPIVGTFYRAPAPDAPPFVEEGDVLTEDSVVCIVEAMKVMNEIKAEKTGTIRRVLVESGTAVEFGQPMFELEPA